MADIPVIFSGAMVRALLDGRKTMTRRLAGDKAIDGLADAIKAVKGEGGRIDLTIYSVVRRGIRAAVTNTKTGETRLITKSGRLSKRRPSDA